jgi:hypothetical protein
MEKKNSNKRTDAFKWHSKQELYTYFNDTYGLQQRHVDKEIVRVQADFKLRKNQAINTAELWQKVGLNLEKKFGGGD